MPVHPVEIGNSPVVGDASDCTHPQLTEVSGIYAFYRCERCGHYFNIQLINIVRHTPDDLALVAVNLLRELETQRQLHIQRERMLNGVSEREHSTSDGPDTNTPHV